MAVILAIDSNKAVLVHLKGLIKEGLPDSTVTTLSQGPAAIKWAIRENPHVILLGALTSHAERMDVCRQLKLDERTRHIPILFLLTDRDNPITRKEALQAGAEAFISFPPEVIELTALINAMVKIKSHSNPRKGPKIEGLMNPRKHHKQPLSFAEQDVMKLVHELEVHKIELERQNEELQLSLEREAELASNKYIDLYDFAPTGFFTISRDGKIINLNRSGAKLLGNDAADLKNTLLADFLSPDSQLLFDQFLARVFYYPSIQNCQLILSLEGKAPAYVHLSGTLNANGEHCLATMLDMTERHKAEEEILLAKIKAGESDLKYKMIFEASGTSNSLFDRNYILTLQNLNSRIELGRVDDTAIGLSVYELFGPEKGRNIAERMERVFQTGIPEIHETQFQLPSGLKWYRSIFQPVKVDNNNTLSLQIISQDITTTKNSEIELLRTKADLEESEAKFRTLSEHSLTGIFIIKDSLLDYVNPSLAQTFGYSQRELIGADPLVFIHPQDLSLVKENIYRKVHGEIQSQKYEFRGIRKTGETIHVLVYSGMTILSGNSLLIGNILDITDRKLAEIKLKESQTLLKSIIDSTSDMIWSVDAHHFGLLNWNNSFREYYLNNRKITLRMGMVTEDMLAGEPEYISFWNDRFRQVMAQDPFSEEYTTSNGTRILHLTFNLLKQEEKTFGISVFAKDITQQKKAEESLQISEYQFRNIFDNLHDAYLQGELSGKLTSVNPSAVRMFGYESAAELMNVPTMNLFINSGQKENMRAKLALKGYLTDYVIQARRKDESTFWTSVNIQFQYNDTGQIVGTVGVVRDISDRMKAKKEIIGAKKRFHTMFEQAPVGITLSNSMTEELVEVNSKFSEIVGRSKEEIKTLGWMKITHPDDLQEDLDLMARVNAGEIPGFQMNKRYLRPDGSSVWVSMTVVKISIDDRHPQNLCMFEDITNRKISEDKIRTLSSAVEQSPLSIVITNTAGTIEYVNPKFTQITGYSSSEVIGSNPRILKSDTKTVEEYQHLWNTITLGQEWHGEFLNIKKDGEAYFESASISPVLDENGNISHFIAIKEDITNRKNTEGQLITLSTVVEQSPTMIVITDQKGKIQFINEKFRAFMNYSPQDILGKEPWIFKQKNHTPESFQSMWDTLNSGQIWQTEFTNRKKDKTPFLENVTVFPLLDSAGAISNYILMKEDITEKKQLLNDLIAAKVEAQESDRLKSSFLANMSHEIRTPLNSIIGFSDLLLDPFFDQEQKSEFITMIKSSGTNLLTIINDILDLSKIEAGQIVLHKERFSVGPIIGEIAGELSLQAHYKGIEIKTLLPDQAIYLVGDKGRLKQILLNFVNNSIKFTDQGSIEIGVQVLPTMVRIHVKDTGIGIPVEFHDTVFQRFRQVESAFTRKYGGNGLGLAISKQLAELMGGEIGMESTPGLGSTFFVTCPRS